MARVNDSDHKGLWLVLVFYPLGVSYPAGTQIIGLDSRNFKSCFGMKSEAISEGQKGILCLSLAAVSGLTRVKVILGTGALIPCKAGLQVQ